jgi:hypothetical protein
MGQWTEVSMGEIKKATSGKECGLYISIVVVPLPYAGITQVRYEGRPMIRLDISAKTLP